MPDNARAPATLASLEKKVIACTRCPRLVEYRRKVAREKRRMYLDCEYWGKPLAGFGDPQAELLLVGLAPAAHGGNRTGRMFTGDRSGDFLYRALYEAGWANQPLSRDRNDGLKLRGCYVTAVVRCAPPANKPLPEEVWNCRYWLQTELRLLPRVRAVLALGRIAFEGYLKALDLPRTQSRFVFSHGASYDLPEGLPHLFASYHPSQQNTQTGRLTTEMMARVLGNIRRFLH